MARFNTLTSHLNPRLRRGRQSRVLAGVAILALLVGSLAPGWALAAGPESEGEGQGTPPPGIGNPALEPEGPETVLPVIPGTGGEESEEAPVEVEPAQEPAAPEAAPTPEEPSAEPAAPPPPPPASAPAEATPSAPQAPPEYAPSQAPPSYEPSPPPSTSEAVENEAIVAPTSSNQGSGQQAAAKKTGDRHPQGDTAEAPSAEAPETAPTPEPEPEPEPTPAPAAALPPGSGSAAGRIVAGQTSYTVRSGDCLWRIAEAILPPSADNSRIAAEVSRLWRLNADRIGTGDPSLIYAGTPLRLV